MYMLYNCVLIVTFQMLYGQSLLDDEVEILFVTILGTLV